MSAIVFEATVAADHQLHFTLPDQLPVGCPVKVTVETIMEEAKVEHFQPRTEIGRLALAARQAYIEGGGKLLSLDEINEEVRRRRGGVADE